MFLDKIVAKWNVMVDSRFVHKVEKLKTNSALTATRFLHLCFNGFWKKNNIFVSKGVWAIQFEILAWGSQGNGGESAQEQEEDRRLEACHVLNVFS